MSAIGPSRPTGQGKVMVKGTRPKRKAVPSKASVGRSRAALWGRLSLVLRQAEVT